MCWGVTQSRGRGSASLRLETALVATADDGAAGRGQACTWTIEGLPATGTPAVGIWVGDARQVAMFISH